jgi:SnoaL-like domain
MSAHTAMSPAEAGDRMAIRDLIEAYAHCADRRDIDGLMSLFAAHLHFALYFDPKASSPTQEAHSREALAAEFGRLWHFDATQHFLGQSTITALNAVRGAGETYCLAHHLKAAGGQRRLNVAAIRYQDAFVKHGGAWLFAERRLYFDWIEDRALTPT